MKPRFRQRVLAWCAAMLLAVPGTAVAQSGTGSAAGADAEAPAAPHPPDDSAGTGTPPSPDAKPEAATPPPPRAEEEDDLLARVRVLAGADAPRLALELLESRSPDPGRTRRWLEWERERLRLYSMLGDWRGIATRARSIPPEVPVQFADEVRTQAAEALIRLGEGAAARRHLRWLIWNSLADRARTAHWRRLVLRSYLGDENLRDARITAERYEREFRPADADWTQLHARIVLAAGDAAAASQMLATDQTPRGRLLRLLARLRGDIYSPEEVIERTRALAQAPEEEGSGFGHELWTLVAEAAGRAADHRLRASALERAVAIEPGIPEWSGLLRASPDDLWDAYLRLARDLGNEANLLRGDPGPWLELAQARAASMPLEARAIHALLVATADDEAVQSEAARELVASLEEAERAPLVITLFTETDRFPAPASLPPAIRYVVADRAVALGDMGFASMLLEGLDEPPPGIERTGWTLRRARVAIYAGRFEEGAAILTGLLASTPSLDEERGIGVLEVLFDLQRVGRYEEALGLFERVYQVTESSRHRREALFWMAECHAQLGRHERAAELYLRAARLAPEANDMWSQTSRYRAAESLAEAGFTDDARRVYESLLRVAGDPRRRAVLQRRIQELWLLEKTGPGPTQ